MLVKEFSITDIYVIDKVLVDLFLSKNLKWTSIYIYWFYEQLQADGTFDTVFVKCMFGAVKDHESPNPNMINILQTNTNHYHYHC